MLWPRAQSISKRRCLPIGIFGRPFKVVANELIGLADKSCVSVERGCGRSLSRNRNQALQLLCDTTALQKSKLSANRISVAGKTCLGSRFGEMWLRMREPCIVQTPTGLLSLPDGERIRRKGIRTLNRSRPCQEAGSVLSHESPPTHGTGARTALPASFHGRKRFERTRLSTPRADMLTWDAENRLVNQTSLSSTPSASRLKLDFAYDAKGRRIQKILST